MATIQAQLPRLDYTGKDYEALVADVLQRLKAAYGDQYTDFEHDNAGRMLVEAFAYLGDMLLFYIDRQANECYLPTARERQRLIDLCKLIGYNVASASPAQADVVFALQAAQDSDVRIPAGTALTTAEKVRFELDRDVVIVTGEISATGRCTEGQTYREAIGKGTGEAGQSYNLPHKGVISVSAVFVGSERWARVESLALSNTRGKDYTVDLDALGRAKIGFGDGRLGAIPEDGMAITAEYRVGGGTGGNVAANTIIRMPTAATNARGEGVIVSVTNPASASGGMDAEEAAHIKTWAPVSFGAQGRLVTQDDYEAAANAFDVEGVGRFAKTKAVVHEQSGEANVIRIYALTQGADGEMVAPSQGLIDAFVESVEEIKMVTDYVDVVPATVQQVDVNAEIAVLQGFVHADVLNTVQEDLRAFMAP